mgnify:CR=1 FL=1
MLGTLLGVFVPCLQNILGVILFLRLPWIAAQAGIVLSLVIVALCVSTTYATSLSMSAEDDIKSIITAMAKDQNALGEDPTRAEADAFMAKYYTPNCITCLLYTSPSPRDS